MKVIELEETNLTTCNTSLEIVEDMARVSEVDVCGKLRNDAPVHARGFIGLVFRVNDMDNEFESFYIRPANGRDCRDSIRKKRACQYFSYPGYTFAYFREYGINDYEAELDTIALGEWSHIKAIVEDETAAFYVDDKLALKVNKLKHGDSKGRIGLYVDIGTDGWFKNLRLKIH